MVNFTGAAGTFNGAGVVYEWSHVIAIFEDDVIVDYITQFEGDALPDIGAAVSLGSGFNVQLTSLTYDHLGGTIAAASLDVASGARFLQAATGFVIGGPLTNDGSVIITAGTTVTGAITNDHLMTVDSFLKLRPVDGDFALSGFGDLRLRGGMLTGEGGSSSITDFSNSSRISGYGIIGSDFGHATFPSDAGFLTLTNTAAGVIEADVSGQTLEINTQLTAANPVVNAGMLAARNGATLEFDGYNGSIDGSPLFVNQSGAGTIKAYAGSVVRLDDTVVRGGTLDGQGNGLIVVDSFYTRLGDLDVTATATVNLGRWVVLEGEIENRGKLIADNFDSTTTIDAGGVTLSGNGSFKLVDNYGESIIAGVAGGTVLTNGAAHTILGAGGIVGGDLSLVNQGTISARPDSYSDTNVDTLRLDSLAALTNSGVLEARGLATLTVASIGVVDNAGGTIRAMGEGARVNIISTTIEGGKFQTEGSGVIRFDGNFATLRDVQTTATTHLNVGSSLNLGGDIVNKGTITLDGNSANLRILTEGVQLTGGGTVVLLDNFGDANIAGAAAGAVLTNVDNTIRGDGYIYVANLSLINSGLIYADADPYNDFDSLTIDDLASFVNRGRLEARNGATLVLGNVDDGSIQNIGGTIRAAGAGSVVDLSNSVISGGTLVAVNGGSFSIDRTTWDGRIGQVSADLDMNLNNGRVLTLMGDISHAGQIDFTYRSGLIIAEKTTLTGGGSIFIHEGFEDSWIVAAAAGKTLVNVDNTLGGVGSFGGGSGLLLVNGEDGVITANGAGRTLRVETGAVIRNAGVLTADGGIMDLYDAVTGKGHLEIDHGGTMIVDQGTDHNVTFVGTGADTLSLMRRDSAGGGFDFAISGMNVGDRIRLDVGAGVGQEAGFTFVPTANGGVLRTTIFADGSAIPYDIKLSGLWSEGQFQLIGGADGTFGYIRVLTKDGSSRDDVLTAGSAGQRLIGFDGNDLLISGKGNDVLDGSRGSDTADFSKATGGVTVTLDTTAAQAIGGGMGMDRLISIENLIGSAKGDNLTGNAGNNVLDGRKGADVMIGLDGDDTYLVDKAGDTIVEIASQGRDTVLASTSYALGADARVEVLRAAAPGSHAALDLTGNDFDQTITGNGGANRLEGGGGTDILTGLAGADTFVVSGKLGPANVDTFSDFDPAKDSIALARSSFAELSLGGLNAIRFVANTTGLAEDAKDRIIYDTDSGALLYDADGKGGRAAVQFAIIGVDLAVSELDFSIF